MRAQLGGLAAGNCQGWDLYSDTRVPEPPSEPPYHSVSTGGGSFPTSHPQFSFMLVQLQNIVGPGSSL